MRLSPDPFARPSARRTGASAVSRRGSTHVGGAFTLVELLVVIGVIALLISILMPALGKAREQARRTVCGSNLRQWAIALQAYGNDNKGYYPYNRDGDHCSWLGKTAIDFTERYLMGQNGWGADSNAMGNEIHVLYCPTADYYRENQLTWGGFTGQQLVGYYYLPYRRVPGMAVDYTPAGEGWVTKKKPGGPHRHAPIMADIKTRAMSGDWAAYSNHQRRGGVPPTGGNFMFEDGHVAWYHNDQVELGAVNIGIWEFYYKIPLD